MERNILLFIFLFTTILSPGQAIELDWKHDVSVTHLTSDKLKTCNTLITNVSSLYSTFNNPSNVVNTLHWIDDKTDLTFILEPVNVFADNYSSLDLATNVHSITKPNVLLYKASNNEAELRLTVADNFMAGVLKIDDDIIVFEPLNPFKTINDIQMISYSTHDVIQSTPLLCGITDAKNSHIPDDDNSTYSLDTQTGGTSCRLVEVAQAYESGMTTRYGTNANLTTWNAAIWNAVNGLYLGELTLDVEFSIVQEVFNAPIVFPTGGGPANDGCITIYLNNFKTWGEGGGFGAGVTYDIGNLWTTENVTGCRAGSSGVIGAVLEIGGVCTEDRYQIFEDFVGPTAVPPTGGGLANLAVLIAHEAGHNLGMYHNNEVGLNNVMEPILNVNAVDFTNISTNYFELRRQQGTCFSTCSCIEVVAAEPINCTGPTYDIQVSVEHDNTTGTFTIDAGGVSSSQAYGANPQTVTLSGVASGTATITVTDDSNGSCTSTVDMAVPTQPTITYASVAAGSFCEDNLPAAQNVSSNISEDYGSIIIEVNGDDFANSENSAVIKDASGRVLVVHQEGSMTNNGNVVLNSGPLLLSNGPFSVDFQDWFGDGMGSAACQATNGGPGDYEIRDGQGNVIRAAAGLENNAPCGTGNNVAIEITSGISPAIDNTVSGNFAGAGITDATADDGQGSFDGSGLAVGQHYITYTFDSFLGCTAHVDTVDVYALPTLSVNSLTCSADETMYTAEIAVNIGAWNSVASGEAASISVTSGGVGTLSSSTVSATGTITVSNVAIADSFTFTIGDGTENGGCQTALTVNSPGSCSLLPIELLFFNAAKDSGKSRLWWATGSETNNSHFNIERSTNGIAFEKIGEVPGLGTTINQQDYQWFDEHPVLGYNYYRLRQVDFNGDYSLSNTRLVNFGMDADIKIFPNPAKETIHITGIKNVADVFLYNTFGQLIRSYKIGQGVSSTIDIGDLATGTYLVTIWDNKQRPVHKKVVVY